MRFGSMTDVANPSVRPDMGGSGSPSTTRAGPARCGVTGFGIDGLGATEAGVILPDTSAPPPPANPASPPRSLAPPGHIARLSPALLPAAHRPPARAPMQEVGDAGQPLPGDDRAGFHPWLTLTAVAAAAARSQLGGAHKARRDGPEQVRSTLVAARPP